MRKKIFRTAGGYYQLEFISLFKSFISVPNMEKNFPFQRFSYRIAFHLLRRLNIEKHRRDYFKAILKPKTEGANLPIINKIVSVTLSSHLLAEEVRDLYSKQYKEWNEPAPVLIKLNDYYNFKEEPSFSRISQADNVLIVNDVISTGSLNKRLHDEISKLNANVIAIFSVFDTRVKSKAIPEVPQFIEEETDKKLICLYDREIDKFHYNSVGEKVEVYKKIKGITEKVDVDFIEINAILNAPTDIVSKSNLVNAKILWNNDGSYSNSDFLQRLPAEVFHVGHIEDTHSHNSFYPDTAKYFQSKSGIKHLYDTLNKVQYLDVKYRYYINIKNINRAIERLKRVEIDKDAIKENLKKLKLLSEKESYRGLRSKLSKIIELLNALDDKKVTGKEVHEIISELSEIENNLFLGLQSPDTEKEITETKDMFWENLQETEFEVDFVVHPSESGLDHIPRNIFVEILKKRRNPNSFQILRLPRVMMNHEWSVPFFANYFGNTFEGKTVLIIDDASSSGETLLKVIDSVCYLNAKKIIVLSFISRMNDFQSEFLSRIRKISNNHLDINHSSIPIDIYFGAHLNIPSYSANSEDCPHCKGYRLYEKQLKIKDLPDAVKSHLKKGLQILKPVKYREISLIGDAYIIEYLPKSLDVKKMYIYRDFLGKIMHQETSNKSYDVDGINYKNPIKEYSAEDLEIYLSILLHEPNFIPILRKHLPPLYYSLIIYFNSCSVSSTRLSPILKNVEPRLLSHWSEFRRFHYKWRMDSIVFLMNELDPQFYFLENSNFFLVLNLVEQNKHALDQVMYKLWAIFEENPNKRDFLVTYLVK